MKDEMSSLISEMENAGWTFSLNKSGHKTGKAPDGKTIIVMGGTVSDRRAIRNNRSLFNKWKREKNMASVFKCECGKQYNSAQALQGHRRIHKTGEFPCDVCGKVFLLPAALGRHKVMHNPKPEKVETVENNGEVEVVDPVSIHKPEFEAVSVVVPAGKANRDSWESIISDLLEVVGRIEALSKKSNIRERLIEMIGALEI